MKRKNVFFSLFVETPIKTFLQQTTNHLFENPKYYTVLKKAGLNHGGRVHRGSLVRDAKSGNTPARDLNNYNDVLDIDADGMVGAETSLYNTGGMFNTEPFLNYYFDEIAEFLKYQNNKSFNNNVEEGQVSGYYELMLYDAQKSGATLTDSIGDGEIIPYSRKNNYERDVQFGIKYLNFRGEITKSDIVVYQPIEGNELSALLGFDWESIPIEMLLIETAWSSEKLDMMLSDAGMWRVGDIAYLDDFYVRRTPLLRVPGNFQGRQQNWDFISEKERNTHKNFKRGNPPSV
jgi:hypothetical protein